MIKSLKYNKKSEFNLLDFTITSIVSIFILGTFFIISRLLYEGIINGYKSEAIFTQAVYQPVFAGFDFGINVFDTSTLFILVAFILATALATIRFRESPLYFIILIVFGVPFAGLLGFVFNYLFKEIISQEAFISVTKYFPITIAVTTNLHWFALILLMIGSIGLYYNKKQQSDSQSLISN